MRARLRPHSLRAPRRRSRGARGDAVLAGVTILDFSLQLPGPYATMLLRACGARVIRIEPPGGDPARLFDPRMVETLEAGKERLTLDLRVPPARDVAYRLAARADVVVEGFRPGVVGRLGIDYDSIRKHRPDVVYCAISGFGQIGPYRLIPGHDVNYLAVGGALDPGADQAGADVGVPMVDLASGTTAAFLIAAALVERARTGEGRYLDVAMIDSAVFWSRIKAAHGSTGAAEADTSEGREPAYGIVRASDGKYLALGVVEQKFWERLCAVLSWDEWCDDPELARYEDRRRRGAEIFERLRREIAARPRDEWLERLWQADVPATPLNLGEEVERDPHVVARDLFVDDDAREARLRAPIPLLATAAPAPGVVPSAAQEALLEELGYDECAARELAAAGAFGP